MLPIIFLLVTGTSATTFNYKLHESNDATVNECVENAIEQLTKETCVYWEEGDDDGQAVTFLQSGHCSWQASNKTVHLSPNCITDDTCFEILGKVSDVDQPRHHISRHINIKFNCTEKCTVECENGGVVEDDCSCKCQYGFRGERCEELARQRLFSDSTCGVINAEQSGHIALSTYPAEYNKQTFCQWQIKSADPWDVIELSFDDFDLDADDLPPGTHCNDLLRVFGAYGVENPIACDGGKPAKLRSETNWLLVELRTNVFSEQPHKGPSMRYTVINTKSGIKTMSEEQTASASVHSLLAPLLALALRLLF